MGGRPSWVEGQGGISTSTCHFWPVGMCCPLLHRCTLASALPISGPMPAPTWSSPSHRVACPALALPPKAPASWRAPRPTLS